MPASVATTSTCWSQPCCRRACCRTARHARTRGSKLPWRRSRAMRIGPTATSSTKPRVRGVLLQRHPDRGDHGVEHRQPAGEPTDDRANRGPARDPVGVLGAEARVLLPGWYGFGSGIEAYLQAARAPAERRRRLERLRSMAREWPFFLRAAHRTWRWHWRRPIWSIAARYAKLASNRARGRSLFRCISDEWALTGKALAGHQRPADAPRVQILRWRARSATACLTSIR